jgi:hypothetical protein
LAITPWLLRIVIHRAICHVTGMVCECNLWPSMQICDPGFTPYCYRDRCVANLLRERATDTYMTSKMRWNQPVRMRLLSSRIHRLSEQPNAHGTPLLPAQCRRTNHRRTGTANATRQNASATRKSDTRLSRRQQLMSSEPLFGVPIRSTFGGGSNHFTFKIASRS